MNLCCQTLLSLFFQERKGPNPKDKEEEKSASSAFFANHSFESSVETSIFPMKDISALVFSVSLPCHQHRHVLVISLLPLSQSF